jgi:hypothetical protein
VRRPFLDGLQAAGAFVEPVEPAERFEFADVFVEFVGGALPVEGAGPVVALFVTPPDSPLVPARLDAHRSSPAFSPPVGAACLKDVVDESIDVDVSIPRVPRARSQASGMAAIRATGPPHRPGVVVDPSP